MNKQYLRDFINDHCVFRCPPGWGLEGIPKGTMYSWQFYLRRAIFWQWCMQEIATWLLDTHQEGVQYAAMETAGPPMMSAMQVMGHARGMTIPGFTIRKDRKKYGLRNMIEGFPDMGLPVIILDDLANSKSTIKRATDVCQSMGLNVIGAKTIVNKKPISNVDGVPVESIFQVTDFEMKWEDYYATRPAPVIEQFVKVHESVLIPAPYAVLNSKEKTVANLTTVSV